MQFYLGVFLKLNLHKYFNKMNIFKRFRNFIRKENMLIEQERFKIIYFPLSNKYYPKVDDDWLKKVYATGIIIKEDYFPIADGFDTEEKALHFINLYKEHQLLQNVKIINVK